MSFHKSVLYFNSTTLLESEIQIVTQTFATEDDMRMSKHVLQT